MALVVLFVVLVIVSEHLVKENVNGVSVIRGLESIRLRGCASDEIWKLKCELGLTGVEASVVADFSGKPSVERLT